ncbi:rod shape-determining protein MreD [Christensenellaceae bacterium OttesenSCG-928-K19]|nr:rod shape-determining protein MreD [Christensenellaceae bacterium OttesenSCG-928-K19]
MRYVVFVLLGVFGVILSGSFTTGIAIAGIQVDLLLLIIVSIALLDKTSAPIIFAAAAGLFMDIMYSPVLGVYAISYSVAAALVTLVFRNTARFNFLMLLASGAGAYLVKELVMAATVYILGSRFSLLGMLVRYILPAAVLNGVLLLIAYLIFSKLYQTSWMKPKVRRVGDDFGHL